MRQVTARGLNARTLLVLVTGMLFVACGTDPELTFGNDGGRSVAPATTSGTSQDTVPSAAFSPYEAPEMWPIAERVVDPRESGPR